MRLSASGLSVRFALAGLGGAGALAALQAGYWANLLLCLLLIAGLAADAMAHADFLREQGQRADDRWLASVMVHEREARTLSAYLDQAPVPLLAQSEKGVLSAINLAARRFFETDDVVRAPPPDLLAALSETLPGERRSLSLERDGQARTYALTLADFTSGELRARIAALVDIQAEIQAAEAAALRELVQILSHEVANSLTPVTSLAETAAALLEGAGEDKRVAEARLAVESVARRADGLLRFTTAYRALARLPEPVFAPVSLPMFLDEAALLFRSRWQGQGVSLDYARPPDWTVRIDRALFSQALLNVMTNAAEAALEGPGPAQVRLFVLRTPSGRTDLCIEDSGPGVPGADASIVFRPFYTTKAQGTGVGLSLARQIVLAHGGAIALANPGLSGAGGGRDLTRVTISL